MADALTTYSSARRMVAEVAQRRIGVEELLDLHLARVEQTNPALNALVSLNEEQAREAAREQDRVGGAGAPPRPLGGLPFAVKDTHDVAGWPSTSGSPLYADRVATTDTLHVERLRAAGVVVLAKTNVPEMAAGSHTFNPVFGLTRNPWDPTRSAGGSSGGAGCALAAGMVPLADGSDMGGSLRNPASFTSVVGLRPSLGRVPVWPVDHPWDPTSVAGPMARTVDDLSLLLSVLAGPDRRTPYALGEAGESFAAPVVPGLAGCRVAHSVDLGGLFPVDPEVARVVTESVGALERGGATVRDDHPDLSCADAAFRTLRAWRMHASMAADLAEHPEAFKASLAGNIRSGAGLTGDDVAAGFRGFAQAAERMRELFATYDVLALPVSQVPPFPAELEHPAEVDGQPVEDYLAWMASAYVVSTTGCPAISVPAGSTRDGLPVGLQLVGPHGSERRLLEIAAGFERESGAPDVRLLERRSAAG